MLSAISDDTDVGEIFCGWSFLLVLSAENKLPDGSTASLVTIWNMPVSKGSSGLVQTA